MSFQTDLYDAMLADIYALTNRPDLEAETAIALRSATTNAHLTDVYPRDIVTQQVQLPNSANVVALNISTLFPMLRGVSTVRPLDINMNLLAPNEHNQIDVVEMGDIYDPEYGNIRQRIAYVSGDSLVIRYPISITGYVVEYLRAPQTKRALYDSWIAQMSPAIIQFWAAAIVMNTNGNEEKARSYLTQVEKFYIPQLKSNFLMGAQR